MFTIGTCGDINHINVESDKPQKGHGEAARIGTRLAAEVLRTFDKLKPAADGPLRVSSAMVELPLAAGDGGRRGRGEARHRGRAGREEARAEVPRSGAGVQGGSTWPRGSASRSRSRCR